MSATGNVPQRGVAHPISLVTEARRLHEAGFKDTEIVSLFARRGVEPLPAKTTVGKWVKPDRQKAARSDAARWHAIRASARGGRGLGRGHERPEFKIARAQALRELGMAYKGVAIAMAFDFGGDMDEHQWRYAIRNGRFSRSYRRAA